MQISPATIATPPEHGRSQVQQATAQTSILVHGVDVSFSIQTGHKDMIKPVVSLPCFLHFPILTLLLAFTPRDDYDMLKQKFYFKNAPTRRQTSILANHGVRFSVLDYIPGWRPSLMTALDFMHCIYLGKLFFLLSTGLFHL